MLFKARDDHMQEPPKDKEEFIALVGEDLAGMRSQLFGLSDRLGFKAVFYPIVFKDSLHSKVMRKLPSYWWSNPLKDIENIDIPARPKAILSVGRRGARVGHELSKKFNCPIVQIQDPAYKTSSFDLILSPVHDAVKGANVIELSTALHPYSMDKIHSLKVADKNRNKLSIFLGGNNKRFHLDAIDAKPIADSIVSFLDTHDVLVEIIPSRRSSLAFLGELKEELTKYDELEGKYQLHSLENIMGSNNPYPQCLANSDYIAVTQDSVSMISEACATTAEVFIIPMRGRSRRLEAFVKNLLNIKRVRWFQDSALRKEDIKDKKLKTPLDDGIKAAESVKMLLDIN